MFISLVKFQPVSALAALVVIVPGAAAWAADSNLTYKAELTLKETYDSNVYLQDKEPSPLVPNAVPAGKGSWVTTITPRLALDYKFCPAFKVSLSYAPDMVFYHNASSEDYFAHRAGLTLSGKTENVVWEQANAFTYIDGNHLGPTFGQTEGVPAIGGIPLRDRRDAFIYRGGFKLTYTTGHWFFRPVVSAYEHDFKTEQRPNPAGGLYENYVDRQDVNGGLDIGFDVGKKTFVVVGYRYGQQDQFKLLGVDSPYDSAYHRILFGIEGQPLKWLKLAVLGGPDLRDFSARAHQTYPAFDAHEMLYWIDATITLLPTTNDTVTLLNRRFEQPAFSSPSVYEDVTYSVTWKHKFSDHVSASAGFQFYIGDWQAPVNREDWIYTPSATINYTFNQHLVGEASYSYDWVESQVPATSGREYTRHLVSLAMKYTF
jgi:hypothetical protein